jgi:ATP-dependent Lhr-like helicase
VQVIHANPGPKSEITLYDKPDAIPWAGHSVVYAVSDIYQMICENNNTLIFVNTRAQAEMLFQHIWRINDDNLAIGLHHGSLSKEQRQRIEDHMARGALRAVIATSSLDLGIDWADVDLVIQVGAPKRALRAWFSALAGQVIVMIRSAAQFLFLATDLRCWNVLRSCMILMRGCWMMRLIMMAD